MGSEKQAREAIKRDYQQVSTCPSRAIHTAKEIHRYAETAGFIALKIEAELLEAYAVNALGDSIEAIRLANKAYSAALEIEDKTCLVKALNILSIVYFHTHQYERSIRTILHAVGYLGEIDDEQLIAAIYNNLGKTYSASKDYTYALQYFESALEQASKNADPGIIKAIELNMGSTLMQLGNPVEAKRHLLSALKWGTKALDPLLHAEIEYHLAMIFVMAGEYDAADLLLQDSESVLFDVSNSLYLIDYYYHRAQRDIRLSEDEQLFFLNQALMYAQSLDAKQKLCDILLALSDAYERKGDSTQALTLFKQYHALEKELESRHLVKKLEFLKEELEEVGLGRLSFKLEDSLIQEIEIERNRGYRLLEANKELKKIANRDELTGIPNRRSINERLSIFLNSNESMALYMIDIDHFKRYNDTFGHLCGDACLVEISRILSQHADHHADFVGRYGGEEFLYIGRVKSYDEAHQRAESLRQLIESHQVTYAVGDKEHQVTICVGGVYIQNGMGHHKEFLLNASDQQLYRAKEEGRNQAKVVNLS